MKLEDQVTSLELSKKLKEFGVKQDSLFYWLNILNGWAIYSYSDAIEYKSINPISAFTVAELGEMLPIGWASVKRGNGILKNNKKIPSYEIFKSEIESMEKDGSIGDNVNISFESCWVIEAKEADARAKELIYLIENKLVEVPK